MLLEELAQLRKTLDWEPARAALRLLEPRIATQARAAGVEPSKAAAIAAEALHLALRASDEPVGRWILSPHEEDAAEVRWAGVVAGVVRTVQVDRVFRAGLEPMAQGNEAWWIVDYKTAHGDEADPASAVARMRPAFQPQLKAYAEVLRGLHGTRAPVRAGLYYPRLALLDWWEA